jgi:type I restriction-modification system DNA methylase subunit
MKYAALEKAVEALGMREGHDFNYCFCKFLDTALTMFCNNPTEQQTKLLKSTMADPKQKAAFIEAIEQYSEAAEGYNDPLGDMFMERVSHGANGQFFTPENVCEMIARMAMPSQETICDTCSGSGRLLLQGLKIARENGSEPYIYANDLAHTCSQMVLLNLLVNSARGEVSCGDSLKLNFENYRFYHLDRIRQIGGAWLSTYWQYTTDSLAEVNEKRSKWALDILEYGFMVEPPRKANTEPTAVEAKPEPIEPKAEPKVEKLTAVPKYKQLEFEF